VKVAGRTAVERHGRPRDKNDGEKCGSAETGEGQRAMRGQPEAMSRVRTAGSYKGRAAMNQNSTDERDNSPLIWLRVGTVNYEGTGGGTMQC
jgi:hypothetical protein